MALYTDPGLSAYRTIIYREGGFAAATITGSNSYILISTGTNANSNHLVTGANAGLGVFRFDPADYAVPGKTTKLRLDSQAVTNGTAPGITFSMGLYPVTASAGGSATMTVTLGTVVTNSGLSFATPSLGTQPNTTSGDFDVPTAGPFVIVVGCSGAMAANSYASIDAALRFHYV